MDPKFYEIGPGWPAFVATFAMTIAAILLFRSLSKHLRKVRVEAAALGGAAREGAARGQSTPSAADAPTPLGLGVEDGDRRGDVVTGEPRDSQ